MPRCPALACGAPTRRGASTKKSCVRPSGPIRATSSTPGSYKTGGESNRRRPDREGTRWMLGNLANGPRKAAQRRCPFVVGVKQGAGRSKPPGHAVGSRVGEVGTWRSYQRTCISRISFSFVSVANRPAARASAALATVHIGTRTGVRARSCAPATSARSSRSASRRPWWPALRLGLPWPAWAPENGRALSFPKWEKQRSRRRRAVGARLSGELVEHALLDQPAGEAQTPQHRLRLTRLT